MQLEPVSSLAPRVDNQRVAIVGNAASLLGSRLGPDIDRHDLVVRMNNYRLSAELTPDIGRRADIYVCSFWYGKDGITLTPEAVRSHKTIVCPQHEIRGRAGPRHRFAEALVGRRAVYAGDRSEYAAAVAFCGAASPTTGFLAAHLFCTTLRPRSVLICGFDCFADRSNVHYYEHRGHTGFSHDPDRERAAFARLAASDHVRWHEQRSVADSVASESP